MGGYNIYSFDADVFQQLVTAPTMEQCLALAKPIVDDLEDLLDEYGDDDAADLKKWPLKATALAEAIRMRLVSPDWYADLTFGDAAIWDQILHQLDDEPGEEIGIDFQCENDGFLYWDAAIRAAKLGAKLMAEPKFGNSGFRYSGKHRGGDIELLYTYYQTPQVQQLLQQLEQVAPQFEILPDDDEEGERTQFFTGLLEPVRRIAAERRVMWVKTDT